MTGNTLTLIFKAASIVSGVASAFYWVKSAKKEIKPEDPKRGDGHSLDGVWVVNGVDVIKTVVAQSRSNKNAAVLAAFAAVCQVLAEVVPLIKML